MTDCDVQVIRVSSDDVRVKWQSTGKEDVYLISDLRVLNPSTASTSSKSGSTTSTSSVGGGGGDGYTKQLHLGHLGVQVAGNKACVSLTPSTSPSTDGPPTHCVMHVIPRFDVDSINSMEELRYPDISFVCLLVWWRC